MSRGNELGSTRAMSDSETQDVSNVGATEHTPILFHINHVRIMLPTSALGTPEFQKGLDTVFAHNTNRLWPNMRVIDATGTIELASQTWEHCKYISKCSLSSASGSRCYRAHCLRSIWKLVLAHTWLAVPMGRTMIWACATEITCRRLQTKH